MTSPSTNAEGTGLEPLQRITDKIYLFEAEPEPCDQSSSSSTSPSLVIFCTWAGATLRGIQKYVSGQRVLWPKASILLIRTQPTDFVFVPKTRLQSNLAKARKAIHRHVDERKGDKCGPRILLYIMSNGGLYTTMSLIQSLRSSHHEGRAPLDLSPYIRGVIFDCTPGKTEFWRTYRAAIVAVPKFWLPIRMLLKSYFAFTVAYLIIGQRSGILSGAVDTARHDANDIDHLGSSNRLYLYSKADPMIGWRDVESHIEDAKTRAGLMVDALKFTDAPHCALATHDSKRYWDAVQSFWEKAGGDDSVQKPTTIRSRL